MLSEQMKDWGFEEQTKFEGLMPKTMEVMPTMLLIVVTCPLSSAPRNLA